MFALAVGLLALPAISIAADEAAEQKPIYLETLTELVDQKKLDTALELLLREPLVVSSQKAPEVFELSEALFVQLPPDERGRVQGEAIAVVGKIKTVARAIVAHAEAAEKAGDKEQGAKARSAVRLFGETLNKPEHLLVLQLTGKALVNIAEK
ncbi:hypothetical protein C5Y93_25295 [Blastopirellula marina]|uniref:Uncharacterized protein n=2 Tax=Blastopirellula marina TaxID=124 RepID=A0A2S8GG60_9BACT|nr:hypothetical protein C5Y93_25295 [Blastopirellula marina]